MDIISGISHEKSEHTITTPAETLVICAGIVCFFSGLLLPMCSIDLYNYALIPLRLVMPASLALGGLLLVFLGVRSKHRSSGFPFWKDLLLWLAVTVFYLLSYTSPLPSVYINEAETNWPLVRDFRKAYQISMRASAETETVFGFCIPHSYGLRFEWDGHGWTKKFPTVELENGWQIPLSHPVTEGLYTVTYRKADFLPVAVTPYDPDCGENVLTGSTLKDYYRELGAEESEFTEQEQRFWEAMPDIYVIRSDALGRMFPVMELRVTNGGEIVKTVRLAEEDDHFFTYVDRSRESNYFSAQIYALYPVQQRECAVPVSNIFTFEFGQEKKT